MLKPMFKLISEPMSGQERTGQERTPIPSEPAWQKSQQALLANPDDLTAWHRLAETYFAAGLWSQAAATYGALVDRNPTCALAWQNLACVLFFCDHPADELRALQRSIELAPARSRAYYELGKAYNRRDRPEAACRAFERAIAENPQENDAHWELSLVLLSLGRFDRGWHEYQWRWPHIPRLIDCGLPRWTGGDLTGQVLVIQGEQGLGDVLQFIRYAPLVKARADQVIFLGLPPLCRLVAAVPGVDVATDRADQAHALGDWSVPLLNLPQLLGTNELADIPAAVPYLRVPESARQELPDRWPELAPSQADRSGLNSGVQSSLNIGLVWSAGVRPDPESTPNNGNTEPNTEPQIRHLSYAGRSLTLAALAELLAQLNRPEYTLFSLQVGPHSQDLDHCPGGDRVIRLADRIRDFADTAAIVDRLDLVITVDTSVAHLAGGLAKPTWVLLPRSADWRWLRDRSDSPWYPTMRLFRQTTAGDWHGPIGQVATALAQFRTNPTAP